MDDETILDIVGVLGVFIAVGLAVTGWIDGLPALAVLESSSPMFLASVAAIAGAGAVVAFFKNR